jgi:hypothetical protein
MTGRTSRSPAPTARGDHLRGHRRDHDRGCQPRRHPRDQDQRHAERGRSRLHLPLVAPARRRCRPGADGVPGVNVIRAHPLALVNFDSLPTRTHEGGHRRTDPRLREQGRLLRRHARPRPRHGSRRSVSQAGHRADVGLQDQRICRASGRSRLRAQGRKPDDRLRGASRYYSDFYRDAFALECKAMKCCARRWASTMSPS